MKMFRSVRKVVSYIRTKFFPKPFDWDAYWEDVTSCAALNICKRIDKDILQSVYGEAYSPMYLELQCGDPNGTAIYNIKSGSLKWDDRIQDKTHWRGRVHYGTYRPPGIFVGSHS